MSNLKVSLHFYIHDHVELDIGTEQIIIYKIIKSVENKYNYMLLLCESLMV